MTDEVVFAPVRALAEGVRTRRLSPVALAELFLERLERLGPRYNAVVTITRDRALAEARRAEREIGAGRYRGPLHGIPYGAKDLLATAGGIPTTWGAAPLRRQTFDFDATVIRKLEEAGAVLVAKLAMVELAGGMGYRQPHASFTGPGITPWNPGAWSGGSSSGSGSAVAAGLVPFAIGSETWGSILSPAANCGITGLRPTYGRVSRHGAMALSWTLDKLGPLGLTADDCGLVLAAIAGRDPADPTAADRPLSYDDRPVSGRRFRFGVLAGVTEGCEPGVVASFERSLDVLRAIGTVEDVRLPDLPYEIITRTILLVEAASAFEDLVEDGTIAELTAPEDRYGAYARDAILAKDYVKALRLRSGHGARDRRRPRATGRAGGASPGDGGHAPGPRVPQRRRRFGRRSHGRHRQRGRTPALAVPNGFSDAGLPHEPPVHGARVGREHDPRRGPRLPGAHRLASPPPARRVTARSRLLTR